MDGIKLPSVSKVVSYGEPPPGAWIIKYAERGTRIHELCDEWVSDTMFLPPEEEFEQAVNNFIDAISQIGVDKSKLVIKDHRYHDEYLYQGIPDQHSKSDKILIDIKSGAFNKKFEEKNVMQLSAYTQLVDPYNDDWTMFNIYTKGEKPDIREYKFNPDIFCEFLEKLGEMRRGNEKVLC